MFGRSARRRRGKRVDEGFDSGHPMAGVMRSLNPRDAEMDPEARERMMGHLFSIQRRLSVKERGRRRFRLKAALIPAAVAVVAAVVVLAIIMPGEEGPAPERHLASVKVLAGTVEVKPSNGAWRSVVDGETVESGDTVRTVEGSFAAMVFPEGSVMRINDGSEVRIKGLGAQSVTLEHVRGGTYHRVHKGTRYTVMNQGIASRALGTAFNVDTRVPGNLEILTVQSAVEVRIGAHNPITVDEGEVIVVSLTEKKKAVKQRVSRERLAEGSLYANVQQDAQDGYDTGIYEQVDVKPEEHPEEQPDEPGDATPEILLEGVATDTGVSMAWSWSVDNQGGYDELVVLRSEFSEPVYPDNEIARYYDVSIKTATDDSVVGGRTYQYRLAARSGYASVTYSNTVVVNVPEMEPEPKPASISLSSALHANGVALEWSVSGATVFDGFVVERLVGEAPVGSRTPEGRVVVTRIESRDVFYTYLDSDVASGHTYTYRVGLIVEGAVMIYSNSRTVEIP